MPSRRKDGESLISRLRSRLFRGRRIVRSEPGVCDELVREQVRSVLDSITGIPGSIEIQVQQGRVTLSGRVHADAVRPILRTVGEIAGVKAVVDRLHLREPIRSPSEPRGRLPNGKTGKTHRGPIVTTLLGSTAAIRS
jgi:hypothetical protein